MNKKVIVNSTYADAIANQSKWQEGMEINLTDKAIPIPADKVGSADSTDKDKVISVNADGEYELKNPSGGGGISNVTLVDADATITNNKSVIPKADRYVYGLVRVSNNTGIKLSTTTGFENCLQIAEPSTGMIDSTTPSSTTAVTPNRFNFAFKTALVGTNNRITLSAAEKILAKQTLGITEPSHLYSHSIEDGNGGMTYLLNNSSTPLNTIPALMAEIYRLQNTSRISCTGFVRYNQSTSKPDYICVVNDQQQGKITLLDGQDTVITLTIIPPLGSLYDNVLQII